MITSVVQAASVFSREAVRASRRWQTWAQRGAFAAVLLAFVVGAWSLAFTPATDPTQAAMKGHELFLEYALGQLALVVLFAPVLVAQGLVEERDEATLGLLALTRLTPGQILWGKVGSRLFVLATLGILAGSPILAVCTTFGGVGPWQVVNAIVNTLVVLVVLGSLGGIAALIIDGTLGIALAVGGWSLAAFAIVPLLYAVSSGQSDDAVSQLSPLVAAASDDPSGLLPVVAMVPILVVMVRWAGPLFAATIADPDDVHAQGGTSEAMALATRTNRAGWAGLGIVLVAPIVFGAVAVLDNLTGFVPWQDSVRVVLLWVSAVMVQTVGTSLVIILLFRAAAVGRRIAAYRAAAIEALASGTAFPDGMRLLRGRVWGHPVVWREVVTNAFGISSVIARWGFPLWLGGMFFVGIPMLLLHDALVFTAITGILLGSAVTLALSAETIAGERRRRTLELIATSTMHAMTLVGAKVASVAVLAGPFLVASAAALFALWGLDGGSAPLTDSELQMSHLTCGAWQLAWADPWLGAGTTLVWCAALWLGVVCAIMLWALWVREPRHAWLATVGLVAAFVLVPQLSSEILPRSLGDGVATLAFPFSHASRDRYCGTSPWLLASALVYALAACSLFLACTASIRLVVRRDAR